MGKVIEPSSALAHRVAAREFLRGSIAVPPSTTPVQAASLLFERALHRPRLCHVGLAASRPALLNHGRPREIRPTPRRNPSPQKPQSRNPVRRTRPPKPPNATGTSDRP